MKRTLILFLLAICYLVGCNQKLDKFEGLADSHGVTDDIRGSNQNKELWKGIVNKVWIKESWIGSETYEDMSFVITNIEQGELKGEYMERGILKPDLDLYSEKESSNMVLAGDYDECRAELTLKEGDIIKAKLAISVENENLLSVDIQYTGQNEKNTFKFKPYNLRDLETDNRAEFDNDTTDITLEKWGKIKFVSVVRTSLKRKTLFLYLVDDKDNILYDYSGSSAFPNDFRVNDFSFRDINDDGREDLLLILQGITDSKLHKVIIYDQNKLGGFEVDIEKTRKVNYKMSENQKYSLQDIFNRDLKIKYSK